MSGKGAEGKRVVIIGAGVGGLTFAISLKKKLGHTNFTIYEQSNDLGGTWRANTYPGAASDIPTHWYSLSTDLNPYWSHSQVPQPQLQQYWRDLAAKYTITPHITYHTRVESVQWDESRQLYNLVLSDVQTGATREEDAHIVVAALGALEVPKIPDDLSSISEFKGVSFHSARWDHGVDLQNKRVAVIGNGSTASQFLPKITEDPTVKVVNFTRTPAWVLPMSPFEIPKWNQWIFAHVPFAIRLYRAIVVAMQESLFLFILVGGRNNFIRNFLETQLRKHMEKTAPKEYHDMLLPNYPFGCKRLTIDVGYYDALNRPNFELNMDGVDKFTEGGIVTKKGEFIPFDVIILATGFITDKYPLDIKGKGGVSYQQYNEAHGGPTAYYGTAVPGFPNFYMLYGPNTTTGHGSVIFTEEVQTDYISQLIKPVLSNIATTFTVTSTATDRFNAEMNRRLEGSVWTNCASWYRVNQNGKLAALWPGTLSEYWWRMRNVNWGDYEVHGGEAWIRQRRRRMVGNAVVGIILVGLGASAIWTGRNWETEQVKMVRDVVEKVLREASQWWHNLSIPRLW